MTKCIKCKYDWNYKGKLYWATCPRCRLLTKIESSVEVVGVSPTRESEEVLDDLDEAESEFVNKYKETKGNAIVLQKGVDQFGEDRVKVLLKTIKK